MSWLSSFLGSDDPNSVTGKISNTLGTNSGNDSNSTIGQFNNYTGLNGPAALGTPFQVFPNNGGPQSPAPNATTQELQDQNVASAKGFNDSLPGLKQQMAEGLTQQSNQMLGQNKDFINNRDAGRGLLYGGINAGEKGRATASAESNLASSITSNNANLENEGAQLTSGAISSGVNIQQQAQAAQNQIYSQALATQQANNSLITNAAGTGLLAGLLLL